MIVTVVPARIISPGLESEHHVVWSVHTALPEHTLTSPRIENNESLLFEFFKLDVMVWRPCAVMRILLLPHRLPGNTLSS
jgi:hypothetical protein